MSEEQHIELARFLHGRADPRTRGLVLHYGGSYDAFAAVFFGGRRRVVYRRLAILSGVRPGDRVLDVGCGAGYFTRIMAAAAAPGSAVGLDASDSGIARARRVTPQPNCTFVGGIAEAVDAADGSYDVVVTSLMLHHLPEDVRPRAIAEMYRVLRPGGRLLLADFRPPSSRLGRRLVGAVTGPGMQHNAVDLLEPMAREVGFDEIAVGDVRPWMHYVRGRKPESSSDETGSGRIDEEERPTSF